MAFRDAGHRLEVFRTPQYRFFVRDYIANGAPVPLAVFQENYGRAFFDRSGKSQKWNKTATSQRAFKNLMIWSGRVDPSMTEEEWEEFEEESG